jgi:hypothetical protein
MHPPLAKGGVNALAASPPPHVPADERTLIGKDARMSRMGFNWIRIIRLSSDSKACRRIISCAQPFFIGNVDLN